MMRSCSRLHRRASAFNAVNNLETRLTSNWLRDLSCIHRCLSAVLHPSLRHCHLCVHVFLQRGMSFALQATRAVHKKQMPFMGGKRLAVRAVKAAGCAFHRSEAESLDRRSGLLGAGLQEGQEKCFLKKGGKAVAWRSSTVQQAVNYFFGRGEDGTHCKFVEGPMC